MSVLLLGWFNANKLHMDKYVKLYKNLGFQNVKTVTYPISQIMSNFGWLDIRKKNQNKLDKKFDVIHCFSGGSLYYYNLKKINVYSEKIIYDSGPMFPTADCVSNYIINYYEFNNNKKFLISNSIDYFWDIEKKYFLKDQLKNLTHDDDYNDIIFDNKFKYLLINDLNDKIVLHKEINNLIENKKNLDLTQSIFENSIHVQHLRYNEEEYKSVLSSFIS